MLKVFTIVIISIFTFSAFTYSSSANNTDKQTQSNEIKVYKNNKADSSNAPYIKNNKNSTTNIKWAGARSSHYGISPFPNPEQWGVALSEMQNKFPGSTAAAIWIIGTIQKSETCHLEFPGDGKPHTDITFSEKDKHEPYLKYFDEHNIKVFLQIEPGNADIEEVINLVLSRYKKHPSVIGFGVDVEWYRIKEVSKTGKKVTDKLAEEWEKKVKSYNPSYQLFLKHWDRLWMPPTYRGDIVFVDDSQQFTTYEKFENEFVNYWSKYFEPNDVIFQIGYNKDRAVWGDLQDPPKIIGTKLSSKINPNQNCGIFWVDFTLREVLPFNKK